MTNSAPAETSTTADTSPTSSVAATSATWFDSTCTPLFIVFLNPDFSAVTVYVPTSRSGKTYVPALDAVAVVVTPVASLVTVTLASGIPAPVESETVTRNVPSSLCALPKAGKINAANTRVKNAVHKLLVRLPPLPSFDGAHRQPVTFTILPRFIGFPLIPMKSTRLTPFRPNLRLKPFVRSHSWLRQGERLQVTRHC